VVELGDAAISSRAGLAERLTQLLEADARVAAWRRLEFAEDGGVAIVVQLIPGFDGIAAEAIARELELNATSALPRLPWVRVQAVSRGRAEV
jgi:hypothetical protein